MVEYHVPAFLCRGRSFKLGIGQGEANENLNSKFSHPYKPTLKSLLLQRILKSSAHIIPDPASPDSKEEVQANVGNAPTKSVLLEQLQRLKRKSGEGSEPATETGN